MNGYEKRVDAKKRHIKSCALEMLEQYEYDKISVLDIAKYARVSRATIYNHYEDKESLYQEALSEVINDGIARIEDVLSSEGSFMDKFGQMQAIKGGLYRYAENAFKMERRDLMGKTGALSNIQQDKIHLLTIKLLEQGRQEGCIRQDISNDKILDMIKVLRMGIQTLSKNKDPMIHDRDRLNSINQLFLNAIK